MHHPDATGAHASRDSGQLRKVWTARSRSAAPQPAGGALTGFHDPGHPSHACEHEPVHASVMDADGRSPRDVQNGGEMGKQMTQKRRGIALAAAVAALVGLLTGSASAAPTNGNGTETIVVDCGPDGTLELLVQFNSSGAPVFDASGETNGRQYVLSSVAGRFYEGEFEIEPMIDPDFEFTKAYGKRNGYSRTLMCSAGPFVETDEFGTFTGFFDVTLSGK